MKKHIVKMGSRFHVVSYHLVKGKAVLKCSKPDCEINHKAKRRGKMSGSRLVICPSCNHADGKHSEHCKVQKAWKEVCIPWTAQDRAAMERQKYGLTRKEQNA